MKGHFLFLGTGGSMGIPVIGCTCNVCRSSSPKDVRLRASGVLTVNRKHILIDCGPDFRQQALKNKINHLDGVVITHAHHDHTASIDELRVYSMQSTHSVPCLMSKETADDLIDRFKYIFKIPPKAKRLIPQITPEILEGDRGEAVFQGVDFHYFTYCQGGMKVNGLRTGNFAYVTDICDYPESIFEDLQGVEVLVISALRFTPSKMHLSVDEAIDFARKVGAKKTWLTHISHDLSHEQTNAYLPEDVRVAYDGLKIDISAEIQY